MYNRSAFFRAFLVKRTLSRYCLFRLSSLAVCSSICRKWIRLSEFRDGHSFSKCHINGSASINGRSLRESFAIYRLSEPCADQGGHCDAQNRCILYNTHRFQVALLEGSCVQWARNSNYQPPMLLVGQKI